MYDQLYPYINNTFSKLLCGFLKGYNGGQCLASVIEKWQKPFGDHSGVLLGDNFMSMVENQRLLGKHSNHFKNITTRLKNDRFGKSSMNNILYFASKYLKRTFEENSHKIGSIKCGARMKYLLNAAQYVQYFISKYSKRTSEKNHMK